MLQLRRPLFALLSVLFFALSQAAAAFSPPEGPVILTVTGHPDIPGPVLFDRTIIEALPRVSFVTATPWTEGEQAFTGTPVAALLDELGVRPDMVRLVAANDYAVDIPVSSVTQEAPILAYLHNDAPMSLRDRGPLWVVYPYDSNPEYRRDVIYSRSVWQLVRIEIQP